MDTKKIIILSILVLFSIFAWFGFADKLAYSMNANGLRETTEAFVLVKSFNAIISFAQNLPVVGAIFRPYDDFFDRMSWVMLLSLMSLGIQKVILVAFQSFVFNFIISLSVLTIIVNNIKQFLSNEWTKKIFKLTVVLIVVRFAIPTMQFAVNSIESNTHKIQQNISKERLNTLKEKLLKIDELTKKRDKQIHDEKIKIKQLNDKKANLENQIKEYETEIDNLKYSDKSLLDKADTLIFGSLNKKTKHEIQIREQQIDKLKQEIEQINNKLEELDTSSLDFFNVKSKAKQTLLNLQNITQELFDTFLTSVVLFLFKNILFPLLFLWGLAKLVDSSFKTNYYKKLSKTVDKKIIKVENNA